MSKRYTAILSLLLVLLVGCNGTPTVQQPTAPETGAERVVRTGTLRVGYVISPPSCYKDLQTKQLAGYSVDILNEMGKRLGVKVEWVEEAQWATMIEGLNTRRYDVIGSTSWRNTTRGKVADFVTPVVYSGVGVYLLI
jgi:ABC-type amino acid transport substrate-binding protein